LLKFRGSGDVLEPGKKFRFYPRSKMSKQIRRANARELFAQARRLPIEFRQLRPLAPAFAKRAYAPRSLERRQTRADLAAQHSPGRGDEFQEKRLKGKGRKGNAGYRCQSTDFSRVFLCKQPN